MWQAWQLSASLSCNLRFLLYAVLYTRTRVTAPDAACLQHVVAPLSAHHVGHNVHRSEWENIGIVVGGPGEDTVAAGNQFHEGQQYDFVFDVDVADGMPALKLPVNKGDNPYIAADK